MWWWGSRGAKYNTNTGKVSDPSVQHVSSAGERRAATLTSLFTSVKIDGDPSGQTCEGRREGQGGAGDRGREEREEQECDKKQATY